MTITSLPVADGGSPETASTEPKRWTSLHTFGVIFGAFIGALFALITPNVPALWPVAIKLSEFALASMVVAGGVIAVSIARKRIGVTTAAVCALVLSVNLFTALYAAYSSYSLERYAANAQAANTAPAAVQPLPSPSADQRPVLQPTAPAPVFTGDPGGYHGPTAISWLAGLGKLVTIVPVDPTTITPVPMSSSDNPVTAYKAILQTMLNAEFTARSGNLAGAQHLLDSISTPQFKSESLKGFNYYESLRDALRQIATAQSNDTFTFTVPLNVRPYSVNQVLETVPGGTTVYTLVWNPTSRPGGSWQIQSYQ